MSRDIIEALRQIEKEKGIAFAALVEALEDALLSAYKKTPNAVEHAKVEVDTETGDMRVYELIFPEHIDVEALKVHDEETGEEIGLDLSDVDMSEVERIEVTPDDFGRIAARPPSRSCCALREAEGDVTLNEFTGREGDLVSGVVQQTDPRHNTLVDIGKVEAKLPPGSSRGRVLPARHAHQGDRHQRPQGLQGPPGDRVAHAPCPGQASCSPSRCPRSPTARGADHARRLARDGGRPRTKIAVSSTPGVNAKGACIGPAGAAGAPGSWPSSTARRSTSSTAARIRRR